MSLRSLLMVAVASISFSAQAALVTLSPPDWPPAGSSGLETVLFNLDENGEIFVALGAHGYKNGPLLPNNGFSDFVGAPGIYLPDGAGYANWSFDFSYNLGSCTACSVVLSIDSDWTTGSFSGSAPLYPGALSAFGLAHQDSWNLMMSFFVAGGLNFDPNQTSSTDFSLVAYDPNGGVLASTEINVSVTAATSNPIPEPGTLALVGIGLLGWGVARQRARKS
ncbi:PEP-CTERM sorting domain-containing protein [Comamonadaceae bacterium G21597-S1]|nr:PEP-CTERM sorting domain-containing protein [Comamonadaceae bacterium G21597-S1]